MRRWAAIGLVVALGGCAEFGVMGPSACEEWVRPQLADPASYTWTGSHWNSPGPDVVITFTASVDGRTIQQHAECNFVDPDAETLEVDPARSRINPFEFEDD